MISKQIDSDGYFQFSGELYGDIYLKGTNVILFKVLLTLTLLNSLREHTDNIARFEPSVSGKTIDIKGVAIDPRDAKPATRAAVCNVMSTQQLSTI